jgi:bis(5'-adenosyl)-triphosphatase
MEFGDHFIPEDHIIHKTRHTFIFTNIRPFLPYHILVSPISKKRSITDLSGEEAGDLFDCVRRCAVGMRKLCDGYTINIQDRPCAGQKVFHLHVHIVPRRVKDLENNDLIYKEGALDYVRGDRTPEEMKVEADFLRPFIAKGFECG